MQRDTARKSEWEDFSEQKRRYNNTKLKMNIGTAFKLLIILSVREARNRVTFPRAISAIKETIRMEHTVTLSLVIPVIHDDGSL